MILILSFRYVRTVGEVTLLIQSMNMQSMLQNSVRKMIMPVVACCAISSYDGEIEMWKSLEPGDWKGISHVCEHKGEMLFDSAKNTHLKKEKVKVPCYSLDTYLRLNNIEHIDYLKIDVEGHETDIIESYSWKVKPTFIKLEHMHIDDINMRRILEEQGICGVY